jgi:hypothetical protein
MSLGVEKLFCNKLWLATLNAVEGALDRHWQSDAGDRGLLRPHPPEKPQLDEDLP